MANLREHAAKGAVDSNEFMDKIETKCDPDDYVSPDFYQLLYAAATEGGGHDIAKGIRVKVYEDGRRADRSLLHDLSVSWNTAWPAAYPAKTDKKMTLTRA